MRGAVPCAPPPRTRRRDRSPPSPPTDCTGARDRSALQGSSAEADAGVLHDLAREVLGRAPVRLHDDIVQPAIVVIDPIDVPIALTVARLAGLDLVQPL